MYYKIPLVRVVLELENFSCRAEDEREALTSARLACMYHGQIVNCEYLSIEDFERLD